MSQQESRSEMRSRITALIERELKEYRNGNRDNVSSNADIAERFGFHRGTVKDFFLSDLSYKDRKERADILTGKKERLKIQPKVIAEFREEMELQGLAIVHLLRSLGDYAKSFDRSRPGIRKYLRDGLSKEEYKKWVEKVKEQKVYLGNLSGKLLRREVVDEVDREIIAFMEGRIKTLRSAADIGRRFNVSGGTIRGYLREGLDLSIRTIRADVLSNGGGIPGGTCPGPKLSEEKVSKVIQAVRDEIAEHKRGERSEFSTAQELAERFNVHRSTIFVYFKKELTEEEQQYRGQALRYENAKAGHKTSGWSYEEWMDSLDEDDISGIKDRVDHLSS